jgi:hypothetical protein
MSGPTREQVFTALFNLISGITWTNAAGQTNIGFAYARRRIMDWDNATKPALCQVEHRENPTQITGTPYKRLWKVELWIYIDDGKDETLTPTTTVNNILDAIEGALNAGGPRQMLASQNGGVPLVHHVWIEGEIMKVSGDLGGEGIVIVPVSILVP